MSQPAMDRTTYTYRDYCGWEDGRWELIDGVVFDMAAAPSTLHQEMSMALTLQLGPFFRGSRCRLYAAPFDVRLPDGDEPDDEVRTVVQPDLAVICDMHKLTRSGCRGAPDWIIEVVSPSTSGRDQVDKTRLYERHQVREYWIVHPIDHLATMYRLNDGGSYGRAEMRKLEGRYASPTFAGLEINWDEVMASVLSLPIA